MRERGVENGTVVQYPDLAAQLQAALLAAADGERRGGERERGGVGVDEARQRHVGGLTAAR